MAKSCVGAPETAGGPLALKDVLILVSFLNLATGFENMNDHFFNAISLMWQPPSLRKNLSNHVTWMSYSLLTKARDTCFSSTFHERDSRWSETQTNVFLTLLFFFLFSTSYFCELAFLSQAYVSPNTPVSWRGHYTVKKHRPSDETLNRGPDSLWSLKIPWHFS